MKRIFSVALVMCCLLTCLVGCQREADKSQRPVVTSSSTIPTGSTTASSSTVPTVPTGSTTVSSSTVPGGTTSSSVTTKPTTKPTDKPTTNTSSVPTTPTTVAGLSLPYEIPGTGLIVERVSAYNGIYVEDGSNADITGVAMILLHNRGKKDIDMATITLQYERFTREFVVTSLPKGMSVVVQEKSRKAMAAGKLLACTASVIESNEDMLLSDSYISVKENSDNSLTVQNLTNRDMPAVRIFYKYFMEDQQLLVGGITFTVHVTDLKAGQSVTIKPSHYLKGASQIIMVQTYEVE